MQTVLLTHFQEPRTGIELFDERHIQPTSFNVCQLWKHICYVSRPPECAVMKNEWYAIEATTLRRSYTLTVSDW